MSDEHEPLENGRLRELQLLRALFDRTETMYWVKDFDGRMLLCNEAAARSGGTTRKGMQGKLAEEIWAHNVTSKWLMDDREVIRSGRAKRNILDVIPQPKTGEVRWCRANKFPLLDDDGEVFAVLVEAVDVNDLLPPDLVEGEPHPFSPQPSQPPIPSPVN